MSLKIDQMLSKFAFFLSIGFGDSDGYPTEEGLFLVLLSIVSMYNQVKT